MAVSPLHHGCMNRGRNYPGKNSKTGHVGRGISLTPLQSIHAVLVGLSSLGNNPYDYTQIQEAGQTAGSRGLKGGSLLSVVKRCG